MLLQIILTAGPAELRQGLTRKSRVDKDNSEDEK
jgi:hypothetical protein